MRNTLHTPRRHGLKLKRLLRTLRRGRQESGRPHEQQAAALSAEARQLHARLRALPTFVYAADIPNGVVELVIEDAVCARCLFDIHDGEIAELEPASAVPWVSIAGSPSAWAAVLGVQAGTSALRLTGEQVLGRRLLAALPRPSVSRQAGGEPAPA